MYPISFLCFASTLLLLIRASYIDTLKKCEIDDSDCGTQQLQKSLQDIAKTGIPELGIPPLDPITLNNISFSILNTVELTLVEGHLKGIKDCVIEKFVTNTKDGKAVIELLCDVTVKGKYKVYSSGPKIKKVFGGTTIHGEGNGKVKIEKLHLRLEYNFAVVKRNGEHYIKFKKNKKYNYEIRGKIVFAADNLFLGNEEVSKLVTTLLNKNWKLLLPEYGGPIMDKCIAMTNEFIEKLFDGLPASKYISGDLTQYEVKE